MNIMEFMMDNFVWILVVLLLTIVTIIGFLVDKKKNDKKKNEQVNGMNVQNYSAPVNGGGQNFSQNMQPVNFNSQPVNTNGNMVNNMMNGNNFPNNSIKQPMMSGNDNMVQSVTPPSSLQNFQPQMFSEPVSTPVVEQQNAMQPQMVTQIPIQEPEPMMQQPVTNTPYVNPMPEFMQQNKVMYQPNQQVMQVNTVQPEPIYQNNPVSMQSVPSAENNQMVQPQMNVPQMSNVQMPQGPASVNMPNNGYNNAPNQPMSTQPAYNQQTQFQPVNFVYGNQNSNQN